MRTLRWVLVGLMALYGLSQLFAAGSTLAAKAGWLHDPQLTLLATIVTWPRMSVWITIGLLAIIAAVMLARRDRRAVVVFGVAACAATINLIINETSPVYHQVFDKPQRMIDWYMVTALYFVLFGALMVDWKGRNSPTPAAG
jgi:hypothetical protein